ncbi:MAG: transposase [Candidatus Thiodiazotropha sp. (ex Lucinoma aequizonata)]|nr:transposase [Candidatus Thiodiazotropha sp. (ex Lucinoma aequizonata)]
MLDWIEDIAESSDHTYGSRRIKKALNPLGFYSPQLAANIGE